MDFGKDWQISRSLESHPDTGEIENHAPSRRSPRLANKPTVPYLQTENNLDAIVANVTAVFQDSAEAQPPRQHRCDICGKILATGYSLTVHRRIHSGERPYSCAYCTKTFKTSSHLAVHTRVHTGVKPYKCLYCGRTCSQQSSVEKHQFTHFEFAFL